MEDQNKAPLLSISGILIVLTTLGVVLYSPKPYKPTRPFIENINENKIRARLWQDPFVAVIDAYSKSNKEDYKSEGKAPELSRQYTKKNNPVTVLGVMIPGGPYENDTENRMRSRYAVVVGLERLGYQPKDSEHINFFKYLYDCENCRGIEKDAGRLAINNIVAYEWYEKKNDKDLVLVLWLNDNEFNSKPVEKIFKLYNSVIKQNSIPFKIIGPFSSTVMVKMLSGMKGGNDTTAYDMPAIYGMPNGVKTISNAYPIELYSARATVAPYILLQRAEYTTSSIIVNSINLALDRYVSPALKSGFINERIKRHFEEKQWFNSQTILNTVALNYIKAQFGRQRILFIPGINNDSVLIEKIITELELRGTKICSRKTAMEKEHIFLVSEYDSIYGRSLPQAFIDYVEMMYKKKTEQTINYIGTYAQKMPVRIDHYSYLRGLDGRVPGEKDDKQYNQENKNPGIKNIVNDLQKLEEPWGKSQYDYLRRLADNMYNYSQLLKENNNTRGEIKAIGVLGSDFYDKLLILQALRERFPNTLFFTTDLDARLAHPAYFTWTHNIIVASNYPLVLRPKMQGGIPPFRDAYQTSIFISVLKAFKSQNPVIKVNIPELPDPCVYEVGRFKIYPLKQKNEIQSMSDKIVNGVIEVINHIELEPNDSQSFLMFLYNIGLVTVLMFLCLFMLWTLSTVVTKYVWKIFFIIIASSLFAILVYWISNSAGEEPFSLFDGVSVWPSIIIRLAAIIVSLHYIILIWARLKENDITLESDFDLKKNLSTLAENAFKECIRVIRTKVGGKINWNKVFDIVKNAGNKMRYDWREVLTRPIGGEEKQPVVSHIYWNNYTDRNVLWIILMRIIPRMVLFIIICGGFIGIFNPPVAPLRGDITRLLYSIILILSIGHFIFLTLFVFDTSHNLCYFIQYSSKSKPAWDMKSLQVFISAYSSTKKDINEKSKDILGELFLIRLIGNRTDVVGKFVFYPFIIWVLLFFARSRYFDNMDTPIALAVILTLFVSITWSCMYRLRQWSMRARSQSLTRLGNELNSERFSSNPDVEHMKFINDVIEEIKGISVGSFALVSQQPLLRAVLVPFGGMGGYALLEYLMQMNIF